MPLTDAQKESIKSYDAEIAKVISDADKKKSQLLLEASEKQQPLLDERDKQLDAIPNFWSNALKGPGFSLREMMNATVDPMLVRAVEKLRVTVSNHNGEMARKVSIVFGKNIFVEEGEVSREVLPDGSTVSIVPLKWKEGTERSREDSIFAAFTPEGSPEILAECDVIYHNPFIALQEPEDDDE